MNRIKAYHPGRELDVFIPSTATILELDLVDAGIPAGFPSPAEDYLDMKLDINKYLVRNPSSTFFARVNGSSMTGAGIHDGDILVIDKSLRPKADSVLVCFIDGEFTVKRVSRQSDGFYLMPENKDFKPVKISPESDFRLWGVVTYSIHAHY